MRPVWKNLEKKYEWLKTEYYEFDDSKEIVERYGLDKGVIPVFIFLDTAGNELERFQGSVGQKLLEYKILEYKDK